VQLANNAAFHLFRGLVGKCYGKDAPVIVAAAQQQLDVFGGKGIGFSGTGRCAIYGEVADKQYNFDLYGKYKQFLIFERRFCDGIFYKKYAYAFLSRFNLSVVSQPDNHDKSLTDLFSIRLLF
jgi:hypothetical protein